MNRCISISFLFILCINLILMFFFTLLDTDQINNTLLISHFNPSDFKRKSQFNISKPEDVMVFFHIQKTGGSRFESDLVTKIKGLYCPGQLIKLQRNQRIVSRKHRCSRLKSNENWILTRRTVGWPCGVHPDYITLKLCAPLYLSNSYGEREWNLFFFTLIRNPVSRFISEYLHVSRGALWPVYKKSCSHSPRRTWLNFETLPYQCEFMKRDRVALSLDEFLNCPQNPAMNRMTRMLADNINFECTHKSSLNTQEKDILMLDTAKLNLESMDHFGILEYFVESKELFEDTFSLEYTAVSQYTPSHSDSYDITDKHRVDIELANHLDIMLYEWAVKLFKSRLRSLRRLV